MGQVRAPALVATIAAAAALACLGTGCSSTRTGGGDSGPGSGDRAVVGLVTKTNSNPYFVKLRESAKAEADKRGAKLIALAGKFDGDNQGQVDAINNLVAQKVTGILITPSSSGGVLDAIAAARQKGVIVVALDTATDPAGAVDATFATDNKAAGVTQGTYVRAALKGARPKAVLLDGTPGSSVDDLRHKGFLEGFGEPASAIRGTAVTNGDQTKAQTAMENLLQREPGINAVYTINEPAAAGAAQALASKKNVVIGSIDGSCAGVRNVAAGRFAATVMQFPEKMARMGVDAVAGYAKDRSRKPKGFVDTGSQLVTDKPAGTVASKDTAWGLKNCWGQER
ncbi:substrate-binding domain-containing protein [Streptomyces sp. NBC_00388]|uniref:substrate-binding domain-containing protein n=1 Tax=Streptomyces sp. NBC_00388 TaxID=2975735 RepID=UPI002E22CD6E